MIHETFHGHDREDATKGYGRVLVIEDEAFNRMLLRKLLAEHGAEIRECDHGGAALAMAKKFRPDVAIVDVQLPDIDGFTVCRQLKSDPLTADVPVIILTALSDIADLEVGFEAGALDYIRKPFNPRELLVRVRNAVELKRRGDSLRQWKDRTSRELALASALQRTILSMHPHLHERLRIHPAYHPTGELGGDFYDVVPLPDGRLAIYVGDVAGHGVGPAIVSTLLKASLSELLPRHAAQGPARVCNELHTRFLRQLDMPSLFATLFLAFVDVERRQWTCLSCGHPAPVIPSAFADLRPALDQRGGPPIGLALAPAAPFSAQDEVTFHAPADATLLFITDGLLDARPQGGSPDDNREAITRLLDEWHANRVGPAAEHVLRRMRELGYELAVDDCTALSVEHVSLDAVLLERSWPLTHDALQEAAAAIETTLCEAGWAEEPAWAVGLLVLEHVANVIRHGLAPDPSQFCAQLRLCSNRCELLVRDNGKPWAYPETAVDPDPHADHGRGLFMMRRIADRIDACRVGGANLTSFVVRNDWSPAP